MGKKAVQGRPMKGKDVNGKIANGKATVGKVGSSKKTDGKNLNGTNTNGKNINGTNLQGKNTNGKITNGMNVNSKSINGKAINGRDPSSKIAIDKRTNGKTTNAKVVKSESAHPPKFFKVFPFLKLPAELRIKIYNYSFGKHVLEILPLGKGSGLTSWNPRSKKPKSSLRNSKPLETRGRSSRPGRADKRLSKWPKPESLPGLAALLLTCKQIHGEAHHLLYEQVTFIICSQTVLHRFLVNLSPPCLATIRTLKLQHHTYGEPYLNEHRVWKEEYDSKWAALCLEAGERMTGLKELEVRLSICDWPTELNLQTPWALPLLAFAGGQLEKVKIELEMNGRCVDWKDLRACAAVLERELVGQKNRLDVGSPSVRNTNTTSSPSSFRSIILQHRFHIRLHSLIAPYLPLPLPKTHPTAAMSRQLARQLLRRQRPSILPATSVPQDWGHQPDSVVAEHLFERILKVLQTCLNATKDFLRRAVQQLISHLQTPTPVSCPPDTPRAGTPPPPPPPLTNFPLMRLPPDIRMHVYEQILDDVHVLEYERFHRIVAPNLSILLASRTVHHEARMLYYDVHDFEFESVAEIHRLVPAPPHRHRIKTLTLHFHFGLDDNALAHWQSVCAAVAAAFPAVRRLDVRWRVWWGGSQEYPTAPHLRPAWDRGMRALRSMKGLRTVEGRVTTQVMGRARAESANFVLDWVGLDGLQEAFWERQAERVGSVYDEYPEPEGFW